MTIGLSREEELASQLKTLWNKIVGCEISTAERNDVFCQLLKLIKQLISIFGSADDEKKTSIDSSQLFNFLLPILSYQTIPLDLRNNCGLLCMKIYLTYNSLPLKVIMEVLDKKETYSCIEDVGQLAIFHGILCCCTIEQLFESISIDNDDIAIYILRRIFELLSVSSDGNVVIISSRILNHILLRLNDFIVMECTAGPIIFTKFYGRYSIESPICNQIFDMIWLLWDHYLDSAKHLARETFILLIKFQQTLDYQKAFSYFTNIGLSLVRELPKKKFAFNAISFLVPLVGSEMLLSSDKNLLVKLVKLLSDSSYATHSANLLESLFNKHKTEVKNDDWIKFWFSSYFKNFSKEMLLYGFESHLGKLFTSSDSIFFAINSFISNKTLSVNEFCLLILTLKLGIKMHLSLSNSVNSFQGGDKIYLWKHIVPFNYIICALESFDPTVRTLAFNLLNDCSKSTELYNQNELDAILNYIEKNISNQEAAFRQKFLNCIKKMLNRINKGIAAKKKIRKMKGNTLEEDLFAIHEYFVINFFNNIVDNLYCGANFPRRYTSLLILELITDTLMNSKTEPPGSFCYISSQLCNTYLRDSLLMCHCDSYETIKKLSYKLLKSIGLLSRQCINYNDFGASILESAWKMSSSPRPLDSLTSSYIINSVVVSDNAEALFQIDTSTKSNSIELNIAICNYVHNKLREESIVAEKSLLRAASTAPMYGQILVLRNLFANFDESISYHETLPVLLSNIVSTCCYISNLVADIVKNASPEGQLPIDTNFENEYLVKALSSSIAAQEKGLVSLESNNSLSLDALAKARAICAQMLLLCGWRSIKEISLLFGFLVQRFASPKNKNNLLSHSQIEDIGNFFMNQLIETRHRGAFEQAYSGFLMVCETLWQNTDLSLNGLPELWLKHILNTITDSSDHRLCATRRSAGIPFIVQAILSTEPTIRNGLSLEYTAGALVKLTCDLNIEPKLHSMNILRALYRETRLGDAIMPYVTSGVKIAISAYNSGAWNVRNSASLLFSSLVTRMLGVKRSQDDLHSKNSISALIFFKRYPLLYDFFLETMETSIGQMNKGKLVPSTYLVLLLLARFSPLSSEGHSTSIPLTPFIPLILNFCSSSVYQLRILAAKAFIPLLTPPVIIPTFNDLCQKISSRNQNQIHGNLLFLLQILKSYNESLLQSSINMNMIKDSLLSIIWVATESNPCLYTRALAMELFSKPGVLDILLIEHTEQLAASCYLLISRSNHLVIQPGSFQLLGNATKLYLNIDRQIFKDKAKISLLLELMNNANNEVRTVIFDNLLIAEEVPICFIKNTVMHLKKDNFNMKNSNSHAIFLATQLCKRNIENLLSMQDIAETLKIILNNWTQEYREDHLSTLINISSKIIKLILKNNWDNESERILQWAEDVTMYSSVENSSVVRTSATEALSLVLEDWHSENKNAEEAELLILKAALELFTDDDVYIQNSIAKGTLLYLKNRKMVLDVPLTSIENSQSFSIHDILNFLFLYLAQGKTEYLSLLIQHSLREDQIEEFGLAQVKEDDRSFEKGETKVNREDIQIAKYAAKAITDAIPFGIMDTLNFNIGLISKYLLLPISEILPPLGTCDKDGGVNYQNCDTIRFLTILKKEIEYILDKCSILKQKDIFSFQHFDIWISRLGCRSLIWMAFKEFANKSKINIDAMYIENIKCSLMRPRILLNILEWLS